MAYLFYTITFLFLLCATGKPIPQSTCTPYPS